MFNPKRMPVHGIRKWRGGPSGYFRNLRTTSEHRANQFDPDTPPARGARRGKNLPTCWDDLKRCVQKSWKSHRRTQEK